MNTNFGAMLRAGAAMWIAAGSALAAQPSFSEAGIPFLQQHCVSCHGKDKQKGDLALHEFRDEVSVLRARKRWRDVVGMVSLGEMPPEDKEQPADVEKKQFLASIAAIFAQADAAKPDPGRLTVRRLNRTEYNNTIRDLLQIDFRPADDFPSDDVGHGFDNIADVLSLSPVLMERYLDAADSIAQQAIPPGAAKAPKHTMSGRFCEPASAHVPPDRFRPLNAAEKDFVLAGPLNTPARITPDGDYVMRVRLYAKGGQKIDYTALGTPPQLFAQGYLIDAN